jgi:hypothetical protein
VSGLGLSVPSDDGCPDLSTASVDATSLPYLIGSLNYVSDGKPPLTQASYCGTEMQTSGSSAGI